MSSAFVREAFYAALPAELPGFEFVPTLNVWTVQAELPADGWYSIDFVATECVRTSLGNPGCFRERGSAVVTLAAPAMAGDIDLARQADLVWWKFQDWYDPTGRLKVAQANPPIEVDGGDLRGAWWLFEVPLEYEYRHVGPDRSDFPRTATAAAGTSSQELGS